MSVSTPSSAAPEAPDAPKSLIPAEIDTSEKRLDRFRKLLTRLSTADTKGIDGVNVNTVTIDEMDAAFEALKDRPELKNEVAAYDRAKRELDAADFKLNEEKEKLSKLRYDDILAAAKSVAINVQGLNELVQEGSPYHAARQRAADLKQLKTKPKGAKTDADIKALEAKIKGGNDEEQLRKVAEQLLEVRSALGDARESMNRAGNQNETDAIEAHFKREPISSLANEIADADFEVSADLSDVDAKLQEILSRPVVASANEIVSDLEGMKADFVQSNAFDTLQQDVTTKRTALSTAYTTLQDKSKPAVVPTAPEKTKAVGIPETRQELVAASDREVEVMIEKFRIAVRPTLDALEPQTVELKDRSQEALRAGAAYRYASHLNSVALNDADLRKADPIATSQKISDDALKGESRAKVLGYADNKDVPTALETAYRDGTQVYAETLADDRITKLNLREGAFIIAAGRSESKYKSKKATDAHQVKKVEIEAALDLLTSVPEQMLLDFSQASVMFRDFDMALKDKAEIPKSLELAVKEAIASLIEFFKKACENRRQLALKTDLDDADETLEETAKKNEQNSQINEFIQSLDALQEEALRDEKKVTELAKTLGDDDLIAKVTSVLAIVTRKKDAEKMLVNLEDVVKLIAQFGRTLMNEVAETVTKIDKARKAAQVYGTVSSHRDAEEARKTHGAPLKKPFEGFDKDAYEGNVETARVFMSQETPSLS